MMYIFAIYCNFSKTIMQFLSQANFYVMKIYHCSGNCFYIVCFFQRFIPKMFFLNLQVLNLHGKCINKSRSAKDKFSLRLFRSAVCGKKVLQ